jgi:hypothetical protein
MGRVMFGTEEHLTCIQDVPLKGPDGEALCLAYKSSLHFFVAGIYLSDDGYVLRVVGQNAYLELPTGDELQALQAQQSLPDPLPPYSIPLADYAFGYSLWLILLAMAAFELLRRQRTRARHARDAQIPLTEGPPLIQTEGDRFIESQMKAILQDGERVQHQAYTTDAMETAGAALRAKAYFAALTERRLILIEARVGAFKPILENKGVHEVPRANITGVREDTYVLTITLNPGGALRLRVPSSERHFSNQKAFLRDLPRLWGGAPGFAGAEPAPLVPS